MRSISIRLGESITIGDTVIAVEGSDLKSHPSPPSTFYALPALDDLRPILTAILAKGIRKADVARRVGVTRTAITDASKPSEKPWMPAYKTGALLIQKHREVCGKEKFHG